MPTMIAHCRRAICGDLAGLETERELTMQKIAEKAFVAELISEGSWGSRDFGKHKSTMTLYAEGAHYFIEWDIPDLEQTEEIGLTFEHKTLTGYDGVFNLPREAISLLRNAGFHVPKDFE